MDFDFMDILLWVVLPAFVVGGGVIVYIKLGQPKAEEEPLYFRCPGCTHARFAISKGRSVTGACAPIARRTGSFLHPPFGVLSKTNHFRGCRLPGEAVAWASPSSLPAERLPRWRLFDPRHPDAQLSQPLQLRLKAAQKIEQENREHNGRRPAIFPSVPTPDTSIPS